MNKTEDTPSNANLAAGASLVAASRVVGGVLNMLTILCLTRLLPKAEFAIIAWVYLIQETINAVGPLGLPAALAFFVPRLKPGRARALGVYAGLTLLALAFPVAIAVWLGGPFLAETMEVSGLADSFFLLLAISVLADYPGQALQNYLLAREAFARAGLATLFFSGSRFLSLVIPAWLGLGALEIIQFFVLVAVLRGATYGLYLAFFEQGSLKREPDDGWRMRDIFAFGLPLTLSNLVDKVNVQLDKYLIGAVCTAEVFAAYTVGAIELPLVPGIAYSVTAALMPAMIQSYQRGDRRSFLALWHQSMAKVAAIMMPAFVGLFVLAEPAIRVLFSVEYDGAVVPFRVYLCLLPLRLCSYGSVVQALGTSAPVFWASVVGVIINVLLNYPMYLLFGLPGPAIASILVQVGAIITLLWVVPGKLNIPWFKVFPFAMFGRSLTVAAVPALPVWWVASLLPTDLARLIGGGLLYLGLYLPLAVFAGVVSREDLRFVLKFFSLRLFRRAR